jgi:hypothetical protein
MLYDLSTCFPLYKPVNLLVSNYMYLQLGKHSCQIEAKSKQASILVVENTISIKG